ncbi:spirocyclase AveC family protein [Streptomyces sp. NPDC059373]
MTVRHNYQDTAAEHVIRKRLLAPGRVFAVLGLLFLGMQAWTLAHWAARGGWKITYTRPPSLPDLTAVTVRITEVVILLAVIGCAVIAAREWRRLGRPGFDTTIFLGWLLTMWLDVFCGRALQWNPYVFHWDTWLTDVPFLGNAMYYGDEFATVISPGGLDYAAMMLPILIVDRVTRRLFHSRPDWGAARRFGVLFLASFLIQGMVEIALIMAGTYSMDMYAEWVQALSLWGGHWYQIAPLDTLILGGLCTAPLALMRQTWQAGGTPLIYRGLTQIPGAKGSAVRVMAGVGWVSTTIAVWMLAENLMAIDGVPVSDLPAYLALVSP